jgi:hypothetical protein
MNSNFKTVSCPKCGALEGSQCKTATGHEMGSVYPHMDRVRAFAAKQRGSSPANKGVGITRQPTI